MCVCVFVLAFSVRVERARTGVWEREASSHGAAEVNTTTHTSHTHHPPPCHTRFADHTLVAHSDAVDDDNCSALLTADAGAARVTGKGGGGANGGSVTNNNKFLGFLLFWFKPFFF